MKAVGRRRILASEAEGHFLYFVRHGQYHDGDAGSGKLTDIGLLQSSRVARCFEHLSIDRIVSSDVTRAVETATVLGHELGLSSRRLRVLREVLPTRVPGMQVPQEKQREGRERLARIVSQFFVPARRTRHEIVVCHGNLIRCLVLLMTTGRLAGWHSFPSHHASVTSFLVTAEGVALIEFDSRVHLPARLRTD